MKLRFDENDDVVLEDIPDDMMAMVSMQAKARGIDDESLWRELLTQMASSNSP